MKKPGKPTVSPETIAYEMGAYVSRLGGALILEGYPRRDETPEMSLSLA